MKAAEFYSRFNPTLSDALSRFGAKVVPKRKSGWSVDLGPTVLVLAFTTSFKYPWTAIDGGFFKCQGWLLQKPVLQSLEGDLPATEAIRVFDYLDDDTYQAVLDLNNRIKLLSPTARHNDEYAARMRAWMEQQGLNVVPNNPRLDVAPDLHYFSADDVSAWAHLFARLAPDIVRGAAGDAKYISPRRLPLESRG